MKDILQIIKILNYLIAKITFLPHKQIGLEKKAKTLKRTRKDQPLSSDNTCYFHVAGLHKDHGVVWTEGRSIFLAPVSIFQDQVENQEPSKLGEFEYVPVHVRNYFESC